MKPTDKEREEMEKDLDRIFKNGYLIFFQKRKKMKRSGPDEVQEEDKAAE